jgi:hypothetical protein
MVLMTPLISVMTFVSYLWLTVPLAKNMSGFATAWFTMWSRAANSPMKPPNPTAMETIPMCSTLE